MKKFFKRCIPVVILTMVGIVYGAPTNWSTQRDKSLWTLSQIGMEFTSDGTPAGDKIMQINTGGRVIAYGPLLDGAFNPYITGVNLSGYLTGYIETDPVRSAVSGDYFPLAGNSISDPITGALFMGDSTGSFNLGMEASQLNFGAMLDVYGPIIRPKSYVYGVGEKPILAVEGTMFFKGVTGEDVHVYVSNSDGTRATMFRQRYDDKFSIDIYSGSLSSQISSFSFLGDGRLQTDIDISSIISDDKDFTTKKYVDTALTDYVLRDSVDTGFNNTGSDTIIPSEKAVWGLVDGLTTNYVPYRSGDRMYNSNMSYESSGIITIGAPMTIAFTGISLKVNGGAYFKTTGFVGGFIFPSFGTIAGMFGGASGTGNRAGYLQANDGAVGLDIDITSGIGNGIDISTIYGVGIDISSSFGNGIVINRPSPSNTGYALTINSGAMSVDYTGNISTNGDVQIMGWQYFGTGWRQGLSGNNFVTQAYTGGAWVEKHHIAP